MTEALECDISRKLPNQSKTVLISTVQSAIMLLVNYYFHGIDPSIFIAWGLIITFILRLITKDEVVWYGKNKDISS